MSNNNGITVLTANEFPIFEPNQVLTNKDLNAIGAYLEPRSRLTRSKLIGIGIVCGLEVSGDNTSVTVSPGVGVTSDGHLIFVEEPIVNTHYIDFIESANPAYPYLENLNNAVELLSDYVPTGAPTLDAAIISNKIAVLYLECTEEDRANCTNECEELGQVRKYSLRVLLVSQDDANEIAQHTVTCNETGIAYDGELNPSVSLEKLHLKKPQLLSGLNCDEDPPVDATVEPFTAQIIAQKYH